jgi:hypothetical protein
MESNCLAVQVFIEMIEKLASGMDAYLQDQKFLNAYFPKLLEAPLFDGNLSRVRAPFFFLCCVSE